MGNVESYPGEDPITGQHKSKSFPGSAIVDSLIAPCGSLKDTLDGTTTSSSPNQPHGISKLLNQAEALCIQSPSSDAGNGSHSQFDDEYEDFRKDKENFEGEDGAGGSLKDRFRPPNSPGNPTSALFARALVSEVTDNPKTMTPHAMAEREKKLLKAQERARMAKKTGDLSRPVGVPGGVGNPSVMGSIAHALTGTTDPLAAAQAQAAGIRASVMPPNSMSENRAQVDSNNNVASSNGDHQAPPGKYTITIGLSLTRRSSAGHPDSVTRQTVFDFNELQDREYKYVSSTDSSGWRAGGGERGEDATLATAGSDAGDDSDFSGGHGKPAAAAAAGAPSTPTGAAQKAPAPDTVHIPIIHIDAESPEAIDEIISALARGEVFIPHMAIMPEALSVDGVSPPDLVVRFGTERNEDLPPDEWPNWCLEFMHNQLYEYFYGMGARWMKRPFSITLAKKVRWKTVKHMNRYFAHAERVIDAWREKGPQYLDPQLSYIEDGATPEEVARPHGIYLMRNGVPTNYFAPNFDPPYTTKMTRSLLLNVLGKSWDKKRREWTSEPVPRLVTPGMLMTAMCGCGDSNAGGFIANEVTLKNKIDTSAIPIEAKIRSSDPGPSKQHHRPSSLQQAQNTPSQRHHQQQQQQQQQSPRAQQHQQQQQQYPPQTPAGTEAADTDIVSEPVGQMTPSRHAAPDEDASAAATPQSFQQLNLHVSSSSHEEGEGSEASSAMLSPRYGVTAASPDHFASSSPATNNNYNNNNNTDRYAMSLGQQGGDKQDLDVSMDTSDNVQASVTNTNSTIMHMNLSAEKFMKRVVGREEKKDDPETLASDEDWLDSLGKPLQSPAVNSQAQFSSTEKNRVKQALEKERARQIALVSIANEQSANRSQTNPMIRPVEDHGSSRSSGALMTVDTQQGKKTPKDASPSINKNNSGVSLDYSVDSASFLGGDGSTMGGSSLLGGKYATDGSVATAATKETWASNARKKQDPLALSANEHNHHHAHTNARDDDEVSGFSLQESTSSAEAVPSDEELFAVGWAKALDPKSGSYYFFTLDRTKIVWDNPLAPAASASSHRGASVDSADTGSLPPGSALI